MLLDGLGEISEMFRNSFPLSFLFFIPIFIIISPVCPVNAAHEFAIYRMQQFDHYDSKYGNLPDFLHNYTFVRGRMITFVCFLFAFNEEWANIALNLNVISFRDC